MERDDGMDERFTRRGFIVAGGALAAGSAFAEGEGAENGGFVSGVKSVDIQRGVGFSVTQFLSIGKNG